MSKPTLVRLVAEPVHSPVRTATYAGRQHAVIDIVALVGDVVVTGMRSDGPEFVPSEVLAQAPTGWGGRPVVPFHPVDNAEGTANTPATWDTVAFGQCFNATFEDRRLKMEVWLDRAKAEQVGEDAVETLAKADAGEMFEVSIGAYVWMVEEEGTAPDGTPYQYRWLALIPDHVAVGLQSQGGVGACSNEMGCGGPRLLAAVSKPKPRKELVVKEFLARLASLSAEQRATLRTLADAGMSDGELRNLLYSALRAVEPGFDWIIDIFPDSSSVIYICYPEDKTLWYRRTFTVANGAVTLNDDREEVRPVTRYEPTAAVSSSQPVVAANSGGNCSCHRGGDPAAPASKGDLTMPTPSELAGRLIASSSGRFTEADRPKLEALGADKLTTMVSAFADVALDPSAPAPVPTPPVDPDKEDREDTTVPDPDSDKEPAKELTPAEHLARLPKDVQQMVARHQAAERKHRTTLIKALAKVQTRYDATALATKSTEDLEALCEIAGVDLAPGATADFSGLGHLASANLADEDSSAEEYNKVQRDPWGVPAHLAQQLGVRQSPKTDTTSKAAKAS